MTDSMTQESVNSGAGNAGHGRTQEAATGTTPDQGTAPSIEGEATGSRVASRVDDLFRFAIKIGILPGTEPDPQSCIPIFHRWIRERALDGLLIDVADYAHLDDGPRVLLVGHEGNLSLDYAPGTENGQVGLMYSGKRPVGATFAARLAWVARMAISAARLLESEDTLNTRPRFETGTLVFVANDRLTVPTGESDAVALLRPYLTALAATLYPETADKNVITASQTKKDRLRVSLTSGRTSSLDILLDRVS